MSSRASSGAANDASRAAAADHHTCPQPGERPASAIRAAALLVGLGLVSLACTPPLEPDASVAPDAAQDDAGRDAAPTEIVDAEVGTDAEVTPPDGRVPMFVAYGHAGRTVTSCDGGRTWIAEHAFDTNGEDHAPYAGVGRMIHHDGWFVGCAGWGEPTRVILSDDGVEWEDLPDSAFRSTSGTTQRPGQGCSGVTWTGDEYALIGGGRLYTSPDARTWTQHPVAPIPAGAVGGGNGLLVVVGNDDAKISDDGGDTWYGGTGYDPDCGAHTLTPISVVGDRVLIASTDGAACVSDDRGHTFTVSHPGAVRSVARTSDAWIASAGVDALHRSSDGVDWTPVEVGIGAELSAIEHGDGVLVGVARDWMQFFRSEDGGATWSPALSEATGDSPLLSIAFGYANASSACPAP